MPDRFIVPQFIDTEDKIWGPVTVRQFVIILAGVLFAFIAYKLSDFALFLFLAVLDFLLIGIVAFYKVNGAPFHVFAVNFIETTFKKPAVRIWTKENIKVKNIKDKKEDKKEGPVVEKKLTSSRKLSELSLVTDTGGVYKGEKQVNEENSVGA